VPDRNLEMAARIESAPVRYPFSFVVAGDSGAWPDPTAEAIYAQLLRQTAELEPVFFANLGDFAGPGTRERHEAYLRVVSELPVPNLCVIGNHDLDDPSGPEAWAEIHGPRNFDFAYGHTRFIALDAAPGEVGEVDIDISGGYAGPDETALAFLADRLAAAEEPHKIVLMHCPPAFDGRFEPHPEWGFTTGEREFLDLMHEHEVAIVCCAHALLFDHHVQDGTHYLVTGGGGTGLCSHFRGICTAGDGRPEDRGALFHAVEVTVAEDGAISGRVHQAFGGPRITF
jgi:Calcineurin-like phosphoesterase